MTSSKLSFKRLKSLVRWPWSPWKSHHLVLSQFLWNSFLGLSHLSLSLFMTYIYSLDVVSCVRNKLIFTFTSLPVTALSIVSFLNHFRFSSFISTAIVVTTLVFSWLLILPLIRFLVLARGGFIKFFSSYEIIGLPQHRPQWCESFTTQVAPEWRTLLLAQSLMLRQPHPVHLAW